MERFTSLFLTLVVTTAAHAQSDGLPRGAFNLPVTRYEADLGTYGGGATLRSATDFDHANTASEASDRRYIGLPITGAFVEWTVTTAGEGLTLRFTLPDNAAGAGVAGDLTLTINGTNNLTLNLSSYWAWTYFVSSHPRNSPGVRPRMRFDEARFRLPVSLQPGDILRLEKTRTDPFEYGIDFIETEPIPAPRPQPAGTLSVLDHGAVPGDTQSDLAAFNAAWQAARAAGTGLYIPPGYYVLDDKWQLGDSTNLRIIGAGVWYTELYFNTRATSAGGIRTGENTRGIELAHFYMSTILNARHLSGSSIVDYKAFDGVYTDSHIHNTWVTHFETGPWIGDYTRPVNETTGFIFASNRVHNTYADGLNFTQGTRNSIARHNSFRNNGDDAMAIWPANTAGAAIGFNNTLHNNTIEFTYRAGGIGIFGGYGHAVHHNLIRDGIGTSGIRFTEDFPGYHFGNNTSIQIYENTLIGRGTSRDLWNLPRGAIEISGTGIQHLYFTNNDLIDSPRHAIHLRGGSNLYFTNTLIRATGLDPFNNPPGAAIRQYDRATSAAFTRLAMEDIEADPPVRIEVPTANITIASQFPFTDTSTLLVPEGGTATFGVRLSFNPITPATVLISRSHGDPDLTLVSGASLTFDASNWDQYQPVTIAAAEDADFLESSAVFTIQGVGFESTTVTATELENDVNHPPVANDDTAQTDEGVAVIIAPLANDTDQDDNPLTIVRVSNGAHGQVSHNGTIAIYTPDPDFFGDDQFTYTASDGLGGEATATVRVSVREVIAQNPYTMELRVTGYDGSAPLTNFPVLVQLDPTRDGFAYSQFASPLGHDLRFTDAQTNLLAYDIETWNPAGTSTLWVQVPLLTNQTPIYASWGAAENTTPPETTTNGATWSHHYDAVYHLNETAGSRADRSPHRRDGIPFGEATAAPGIAANANRFDGNEDYIELPSTFARFNGFVPVTLEFWFNADTLGADFDWQYSPVLFQGNGESAWMVTLGDGFTRDTLGNRVDQGEWNTPVTTPGIQTGQWFQVVTTYDPTGTNNWNLHLNGERVATANRSGLIGVLREKNAIGGNTVGQDRWFDGRIDEVRVSSIVRCTNYIRAAYQTMHQPDQFITYQPVNGPPPPDLTLLIDFGNTNSYRGFSVTNPDTNGHHWNSIWSGTFYTNLISHTNAPTGITLGFDAVDGTDSFNGPAGDVDPVALGLLGGAPNAVNDYYTSSSFQLGGLDPDMTYTLTFYGAHKYSTDDATRYQIYSDAYSTPIASIDLEVQTPGSPANHNRDQLAIIQNLLPGTNGMLAISFAGRTGNLGYLNAMMIEGRRLIRSPYVLWSDTFPGLGPANDDDDNDGISNYAEFIFGGDPQDPTARGHAISAPPASASNTNSLTLLYPRRATLDSLTYTIEMATNMPPTNWIPLPPLTTHTLTNHTPDFHLISNQLPITHATMYLRLKVAP